MHPRSTLHVLRIASDIAFGHVTLLEAEFQPLNRLVSRTYDARRPLVGLCPKFLFLF